MSSPTLSSSGLTRNPIVAFSMEPTTRQKTTVTARELNHDIEIIARGESPSTEKELLRSGATRVVLPAAIGASRIARLITRPTAEEILSNSFQQETLTEDLEQIALRMNDLCVPANSEFSGRQLGTVTFGASIQFVMIAVRSSNGHVIRDPPSDYILCPDDVLIVLAHCINKSCTVKPCLATTN